MIQRGCRWAEDATDVLEELLREDGYAHLGSGRDGPGATGRLQTGAEWVAAARAIDGSVSSRAQEQERYPRLHV